MNFEMAPTVLLDVCNPVLQYHYLPVVRTDKTFRDRLRDGTDQGGEPLQFLPINYIFLACTATSVP
jgi:hypothetical protein